MGKRAGLAPGTRSGLWSYMAAAIDALQPQLVVIENVRGLLSSPAVRAPLEEDDDAHSNPDHATPGDAALREVEPDPWGLGDLAARPLRAVGAVLGDLADLRYDTQWIGLPASLVGAPHPRLRVFILARSRGTVQDAARHGLDSWRRVTGTGEGEAGDDRALASDHRPRAKRADWLAEQEQRTRDAVVPDRGHLRRWGRYARAIARWEHVTGRIAPALLDRTSGPRPSPEFVEWLMGLPSGWITDPIHQLTANQQIAALGNGVLPLQALSAMRVGALVQADAASLAGVQHPMVSRGCTVSQEEEGADEKAGESA